MMNDKKQTITLTIKTHPKEKTAFKAIHNLKQKQFAYKTKAVRFVSHN